MTQGMENRTMAQCEGADDKCNICPVRSWVQQHRTLLIVCFGVLGVLLLLMLGSRKTVLNIANQPSQAGGNAAKVMVIDNHGFSQEELFEPGHRQWASSTPSAWPVWKWIHVNTVAPFTSFRMKIRRWKREMARRDVIE